MKQVFRYFTVLFISLFLVSPGWSNDRFTIEIDCTPGGSITAHHAASGPVYLGSVTYVPASTRYPSFTASQWGKPWTVVASAVNAIHILVASDSGGGRTFSLLPSGTIAPAAGEGNALVTDIAPGHGLFGAWAPPVGSRVSLTGPDGGSWDGRGSFPQNGRLSIETPGTHTTVFVDIENRPGGRVVIWQNGMRPEIAARVVRPLGGSGRFLGTVFQECGRIRANHPGVIDISTSADGITGGFQILPLEHAASPEMHYAWDLTQWLIVGPLKGAGLLRGSVPLFSGELVPGVHKGEDLWDLWSTYGRKPLVLARLEGGPWEQMPVSEGRNDDGLKKITHIRIYYPFIMEPGGQSETSR